MTWQPHGTNSSGDGGTDYTPQITALQDKDASQDLVIQAVNVRVVALESAPAATDYSPAITALQQKDIVHETRLSAIDSAMLGKAPLVAGKVPYENLPEFPVGRKVNVANKAARLALPSYGDLTIAYESDTGDAYGLDANDDPAIDLNWSKLGNAQALNVASFNGRTGNIGPQTGDYITDQISESLTKQFVSPSQKTEWSAKETTTGAQTKATAAQTAAVASAKTYADGAFISKSQRGVASGVAPLDSNSKVPVANLPTVIPPGWTNPSARKVGTWYTNTSPHTMFLNLRTAETTSTSRFLNVQTRATSSSTAFHQRSTAISVTSSRWIQLLAVVPPGWQYMVDTFGGSTTANVEYWHEMA